MRRSRARKTSTRDIALEARGLAQAHIAECKEDRARLAEQRREDIERHERQRREDQERQDRMHAENLRRWSDWQEEQRQARAEINRRFDAGEKQFDDLKKALGDTDKQVAGEGAKRTEGWNEAYKYIIGVLILALGAFLAFYFFGGKPS